MLNAKTKILTALFLLASIVLIYLPGISGPFLFDDLSSITQNSYIEVESLNTNTLYTSAFSGNAGPLKRPVAMLTFALNYYFSKGFSATGFKVTNIIIHCVNALLVFTLCRLLFTRNALIVGAPANYKRDFFIASSVSLIWAVHPVNLTSVLYIVQRMTSLSTLFSLLSIILYFSARNKWSKDTFSWGISLLFIASFTSLTLALFSKENAVLTPLIILLIELLLYSHEKPKALFNSLPSSYKIIIKAVTLAFAFFLFFSAIDYALPGFASRPFTMLERTLTEFRVVCFYISLILIPRINGFGLFHDDIAISTSLFSPWTTVTSFIFILSLITIAFCYRKKKPLFALGIGWFFIGHLLESTFFSLEIAHEHRNNLPSIGLVLASVSLLSNIKINNKKLIASFLLTSFILGGTTWLRANQWGNYQQLAYYEASHHPNSPATQALLSNAANQAGNIEIATQAIKKAMELDPNETSYAMHYQNLLSIHNKPIPAELQQETLRRIKSNLLTPSTKLALNQIVDCIRKEPCSPLKNNFLTWMNAVIEKKPNEAAYHYIRGKAQRASGNELAALNDFQHSHDINPQFLHPLFEMADILIRKGQVTQAKEVVKWIEESNEKTTFRRDKELHKLKKIITKLERNRAAASLIQMNK